MPVWTVQVAGGEHERVEAWGLATEAGALVALSEDGVLVRAWAPGQWWTVRHLGESSAHPVGRSNGTNVLVGLPQV
ncbi:hypothetical protein DQ238_01120 [Geodermatophilus sp. TF02-6]|uniref:hypothetical protein n=1 Tax=Geodermatophilus sp. TF02-6 TaxID=2250575 RepID=UPI000DEB9C3A|nr:hypothetical protein [Geodermatophilus sp. TF02-6]RBY83712.1 hypothetical protein DQ238_01120 [Geodermatophilus sp. TF02-6]